MNDYAWPARRAPADLGRAARDIVVAVLTAGCVGLLVGVAPSYAILLPAALVAVLLFDRPRPAAIVLGASIPAVESISSAHLGLHIGAGDLLLLLLFLAAVGAAALERNTATFDALRPVALPVLQYCLFVLLLLFAHPGFSALAKTIQRYELIAFPLVVGSYLALRGAHIALLKAYVVAAATLAVVWPLDHLGLQKNPTGQFIGNAVLLVLGVPRLGRFRIVVPLLVYGVFATQSRGAIVACAGGVVVLMALRWMHSPRQAIVTGIAVATIAAFSFAVMPPQTQAFVTTFGSQGQAHANWNVRFRQKYQHDALTIIRAHPWLGIGVGSYASVVAADQLTSTDDPHDVFLLQAAEGGWGFAVSFVLLILGASLLLFRLRWVELAPAALAIVLSTVAHGMVDIYWVRGTPVLGWLLIGMVCAIARSQREPARA